MPRASEDLLQPAAACWRCCMEQAIQHWSRVSSAAVLLVMGTCAQAQAAIASITGGRENGHDVVRIEFTEATDVVPLSFVMQSPPRIAIDLPGIQAGSLGRSVPLGQGTVRAVRLAAAGDRTRLVLDLAEPAELRTTQDRNSLVLKLEPSAVAPVTAPEVLAQATPREKTPARPAVTTKTADAPATRSGGSNNVTLDFANAEIDAVARTMATITGRNVVVDPRVKGTMTLTSTAPVNAAQALRLFGAQLRTQGFALVESNGMYIVLPEAEAKLQSGAVSAGSPPAASGQIMTQIFRLTHENANSLVPILRPLISPNNTINVNPGTNSVVITDYADNLQRLGRIIAALDVSNATGVEIVRLRYGVASDLAPLVARLLESGNGGATVVAQAAPGQAGVNAAALSVGGGDGYRTTLVPEPRSNAIIVRAANGAKLSLAKTLIQQLDQPASNRADGTSGNIHVVYLKNADATKLAVTLRAALAALPGQSNTGGALGAAGGGGASGGLSANQMNQFAQGMNNAANMGGQNSLTAGPSINAAGNNQPATGGQIQADPATNSLIISAPDPIYRELRAVIDKLDQRRAQVFIESLIAEVRADKAAEFGVQWQGILGNNGDRNVGVAGTNFGTLSAGNILGLGNTIANVIDGGNRTTTGVPRPGLNLALAHNFGAGYVLSALANFIQTSNSGNVLSTPTLLTLDNEEAKIIVGQNVPFLTGSYANTGGNTNAVNPFQTIERKDVGLTLRVRPQISESGTVKLVIYQENSSVVPSSVNSTQGLITNKRAIESSVLVDDGSVVVLGGLLEDQLSNTEDKIPGLGDIPVVGNLFKNQNRNYVKTNLMVFLRPVVVRDGEATDAFSLSRYDLLRGQQMANQPKPSSVLQINQAPVMPPITPSNPNAWTRPAPPPPLVDLPAAGEFNRYDQR